MCIEFSLCNDTWEDAVACGKKAITAAKTAKTAKRAIKVMNVAGRWQEA